MKLRLLGLCFALMSSAAIAQVGASAGAKLLRVLPAAGVVIGSHLPDQLTDKAPASSWNVNQSKTDKLLSPGCQNSGVGQPCPDYAKYQADCHLTNRRQLDPVFDKWCSGWDIQRKAPASPGKKDRKVQSKAEPRTFVQEVIDLSPPSAPSKKPSAMGLSDIPDLEGDSAVKKVLPDGWDGTTAEWSTKALGGK